MRPVKRLDAQLVQANNDNRYQLNRFYKRNGHRGKATASHQAWWLEHNGKIVAALRLEPQPWGNLLRGMWVAAQHRGNGVGTQLLELLQPQLIARDCFCLPYRHQLDFYHRNGFIDALNNAPSLLHQQYQRYQNRGERLGLLRYQPPCD